jgi:hypothetical protein
MRIRIQCFTAMRIRILLHIQVLRIINHVSIDPTGLNLSLQTSILSVHGSIEPLKLINFDCNADPDPVHSNADPNLASKNNADRCGLVEFETLRLF